MRIVLAHNFYQQPGGECRVFQDEVELLRERGHEVATFEVHNDDVDGQSRVRLAVRTFWNRSAARELGALARRHGAQVVHFHNTFPLMSPACYYAARSAGAAVVQTLHNYRLICPGYALFRDGHTCTDCVGRRVPWPAVKHRCYRGSRLASGVTAGMVTFHRLLGTWRRVVDAYIVMSDFSREQLIAGGLPGERLVVKRNFMQPDPGARGGRSGHACYVGRLSPEKGLDILLAAWERLDESVPLKIISTGGPLSGQADEFARRRPEVQQYRGIAYEELYDVVGDAAVLIFPSTNYEGCPKTIIESFSLGTPVIASGHGAMAELVTPARTGWHFRPGDAEDLAATVREAFRDRAALAAMRPEVRREFDGNFTAECSYQGLMNVYREALARRHRAALPGGEGDHESPEPSEAAPSKPRETVSR